jgi:protein-S-isoprenylcysteine O-methyltransferase Ste14
MTMRRESGPLIINLLLATLFLLLACGALIAATRTQTIAPLLIAAHESAIAVLVLCRRPAVTTHGQRVGAAVALAWAGTLLPLLLRGDGTPLGLATLGGVLQCVGALLALTATLTLGRSFGVVAANRGVRAHGLYRLVRHPIYAAYLVTGTGVVLSHPSPWNVAVLLVWTSVQAGRALVEERVLAADPAYRAYSAGVRYRLLPGIW